MREILWRFVVSIPEMVRLIGSYATTLTTATRSFNSRDGAIDSLDECRICPVYRVVSIPEMVRLIEMYGGQSAMASQAFQCQRWFD